MDADRPLKTLFRLRAPDLLPVTGDRGARVVARLVPEVTAVTRRLDFVLKLERHGQIYLRHLEFEMRCRSGLAHRVFDYAAALFAEHRLPVASTVIVLKPPAPHSLAHEERVGGRLECRRAIRIVRLWQMKPAAAMKLGVGGAALVGLMGPPNLRVVEAAARRIRLGSSPRQLPDLWAILRMLSEGRYTARELQRVVPREVMMGSSLVAWVKRRSRAEGELTAARGICADFVKQHHPGSLAVLAPIMAASSDVQRLREWALAAPRLSDDDFVRLVTAPAPARRGRRRAPRSGSRTSHRRAPAPSRRSRRR